MIRAYKNPPKGKTISNEGGEVFKITPLQQLERFLYLGAVGGTFYANENDHVGQNLTNVEAAINAHGHDAVDLIVNVGENAPKHDHVLVAYAIAISAEDAEVRSYALSQFNKVVRTGTHLFTLLEYIKGRRGWGGGFRRAVQNWYLSKNDSQLAYAVMKYKNRSGWTHRDVLRKAHPQPTNQTQNGIFKFITSGELLADDSPAHQFIEAALEASTTDDIDRAIELVREFNLPREVINTKFLKDPRMWEALLPKMGMTAMFRNLRNMHKSGFLVQGSDAEREVVRRLNDANALQKGRIHPVQVFLARQNAMYEIDRRDSFWSSRERIENFPQSVTNALEGAFYLSFGNLEGTDKRILVGVDVSGSMTSVIGGTSITSAEWAAVLAMVTVRQAPFAEVYGFSDGFINLGLTPHDSLEDVTRKTQMHTFGWTDCALPMVHARENNKSFDAFVIYTDSETGGAHNVEDELARYRKGFVEDAKLSVVATESNNISIGDPNDPNVLNVCGFSPQTPMLLEKFINGRG